MNLPKLAIERPVFMSCIVILIMVLGYMASQALGVDLFPDVSFPFVSVTTPYKGAAPEEIENLISKPMEEQFSTLEGVKKVYSVNQEGFSVVTVQFTLETDSKDAEQRVRDRLSFVRPRLPKDIDEPVIQRLDPSDQPVMIVALDSTLPAYQAYDLADQVIKPQLSQVDGVGVVDIFGGSKREIRVELDRHRLNAYRISASSVANNIGLNGQNVPVGKYETGGQNTLFRSVGEYNDLERLKHTVVNFLGSDVPITVDKIGRVLDTTEDAQNYSSLNGKASLFLNIHKQSKANTVAVVDGVLKAMGHINAVLKTHPGNPAISLVRDDAKFVRLNLEDVRNTIAIGITLTVLVVFFFLGSVRSTLITITSLPVSLLGAFILMNGMGFTLNLMTLLALSLAVGLLIDDAIVVRENIWRHMEEGEEPKKAALNGTLEVAMAVVATTSVVIAVFLPIAFLKGTVGQFFRQFGMTVCFAMGVSLFEAMVMGPMLSAYWGKAKGGKHVRPAGILHWFDNFQTFLEKQYERLITWSVAEKGKAFLSNRGIVLLAALVIFFVSLFIGVKFVPFTFLPNGDNGEFLVSLKAAPNTALDTMRDKTEKISAIIHKHKEIALTSEVIGDTQGNDNTSTIYAKLTPWQTRKLTTSDMKDLVRKELEPYHDELQPQVADRDLVANQAPFNLVLAGEDYQTLEPLADKLKEQMKSIPGLTDITTNYDGGKAEFQAVLDPVKCRQLGVLGIEAGNELRTQIEGNVPAKFRENGLEYDIRVRDQEDQRNLQKDFYDVWVPNTNHRLIRLSDIAQPVTTEGPSKINRLNRQRYIMISGQLGKGGALQSIRNDAEKMVKAMDLPTGVSYSFIGQSEDMQDLMASMLIAVGLALLFTYMILASLYESPILPVTIMVSIPLAIVGAFVLMALTHQTMNIFSMISMVMLMGLVTKNAILLVDYTVQMERKGIPRNEAIRRAGVIRLRPILMTTLALIVGMLPTALALTEVAKFRQSMGVAVIGGLLSSLFLTLLVVPSVYGYVDDFRLWLRRLFGTDPKTQAKAGKAVKAKA
ncbi:MAG TPA: efflux RND transporter permease subunit [bacterium]|nr:efflux RND transporter permease subunit [bacterium]